MVNIKWQRLLIVSLVWAQSGRYWDSLFAVETRDTVYGEAAWAPTNQRRPLRATFYLPRGDAERKRPMIVFLHGGTFLGGTRNDPDVAHLARYFAQRGYVTASIEYRTGLELISQPTEVLFTRAAIRAVHDFKAFVRFLKHTVIELNNRYGIDTNRIYAGGTSAGAFAVLHAAFVSSSAELAPAVSQNVIDYLQQQGGLEGGSGNPGYSSRFQAAFSLAGGLLRTEWISREKLDAVIAMHSTGDAVVPYKRGPTSVSANLIVEGGYNIDSAAAAQGLYHALFTWNSSEHVPWVSGGIIRPQRMEEVENFLRQHFYQWNRRYATSLSRPEALVELPRAWEVWSIEGRYWGSIQAMDELPSGVWVLMAPSQPARVVYRP
ncbi:MAG: alpha/beta hydrolase [Bacteroidia bacterium]|nr:alpha/beta hydrolase [Bacteroidia bacterium]MDW8235411.1 alpha/beta hydrolase [Bacteroidia bacterium]